MFPNPGPSLLDVTVIGEVLLTEFAKKHDRSRKPLTRFVGLVRVAAWKYMPDVKATFNTVDFDPSSQTYIFDIGGNKYRVLAAIDFEEQLFSVESVITHEQYNRH
jgi:mRNA interferase HigB